MSNFVHRNLLKCDDSTMMRRNDSPSGSEKRLGGNSSSIIEPPRTRLLRVSLLGWRWPTQTRPPDSCARLPTTAGVCWGDGRTLCRRLGRIELVAESDAYAPGRCKSVSDTRPSARAQRFPGRGGHRGGRDSAYRSEKVRPHLDRATPATFHGIAHTC